MAWYDIGSNSGETTVESSFCEYHMDHWSFCTCQGPVSKDMHVLKVVANVLNLGSFIITSVVSLVQAAIALQPSFA